MPNGIKEEYNYDDMGRLTQIAYGTTGRTISYSYDYAGNVIQMTDWTGTTNYSYDNIYQLTSATYPNTGTQNFTYDQAGNRIQDQNRTYYYNNLNQLLSTSDGTNYTYDLNGNLIQKTKGTETTTYTWNEFDRLVEVNLPDGKKIKFVYGADGLRRERIEEERVNYLLDGVAVLCEFDDSLNLLREFVGGVSVCIGSESFYYHYDRLGSVRFVSDSGGSVVCDYVYDAFGNILSSSGNLSQPYQYIGKHYYYTEPDLGLQLLGQRWYDSEAGRFISRDPIGEKSGINLYKYVRNNFNNYFDSLGLYKFNWDFIKDFLNTTNPFNPFCIKNAWRNAITMNKKGDDKVAHCYFSCQLNRCLFLQTPGLITIGGIIWEIIGGVTDIEDIKADIYGIITSYTLGQSCEELCKCLENK